MTTSDYYSKEVVMKTVLQFFLDRMWLTYTIAFVLMLLIVLAAICMPINKD